MLNLFPPRQNTPDFLTRIEICAERRVLRSHLHVMAGPEGQALLLDRCRYAQGRSLQWNRGLEVLARLVFELHLYRTTRTAQSAQDGVTIRPSLSFLPVIPR